MPAQAELKARTPCVDKRAFLSAHPFFKGLGSELIDQVGSHAITRVVKAGTVIYARGDPGDSLFAVVTGTVQISVPSVQLVNRVDQIGPRVFGFSFQLGKRLGLGFGCHGMLQGSRAG